MLSNFGICIVYIASRSARYIVTLIVMQRLVRSYVRLHVRLPSVRAILVIDYLYRAHR